jgi:hypothetical protein
MKYYEIVAGGMSEDAVAFVDRVHEWNGVDALGMPSYLLGGDYVKTFNDDKVNEDLRITVSLERPATLYLLVDDRFENTSWLAEHFEDTGDNIGLDEGINFPQDPRRVARRAGVSIDEIHSIWKSREVVDGTLSIGPFSVSSKASGRGTKAKLNMFGIVAVALPAVEEN